MIWFCQIIRSESSSRTRSGKKKIAPKSFKIMYAVNYWQILAQIIKYCYILKDIVRYCEMWIDIVRYCQILSDIARYCQILQILSDNVEIVFVYCASPPCVFVWKYCASPSWVFFIPLYFCSSVPTYWTFVCLSQPIELCSSVPTYWIFVRLSPPIADRQRTVKHTFVLLYVCPLLQVIGSVM